jgi:hypothetical protein
MSMRLYEGAAMLCLCLSSSTTWRLCFPSAVLSSLGQWESDAVVCARERVEYAWRSGRGGDGSEYRSALEAVLRSAGWFRVISTYRCSLCSEEEAETSWSMRGVRPDVVALHRCITSRHNQAQLSRIGRYLEHHSRNQGLYDNWMETWRT